MERLCKSLFFWASVMAVPTAAFATSFTEVVFATGGPLHATQPESIAYGNGSVWVAYDNNASTRDYSGAGTIVQYNTSGVVQNSYTLAGSLGGLKYNSSSGQVWILQGKDLYSQLSVLNPATNSISSYSFDQDIFVAGTRGFDDVAFVGGRVFLSATTPYFSDSTTGVMIELNNSTPASPIGFTTALTQDNLLARDARALNSTPAGGLILTGRTDQALTFVSNPGLVGQTASSLHLVASPGTMLGDVGDALYADAVSGTFYLTDSATDDVYAVSAMGLDPNTLFVAAGTEFGSVDPTTGVVTPILFGSDLENMTFVPSATPTPEPSTFRISFAGMAFVLSLLLGRRVARTVADPAPIQ